jgi:hypothetical protein
MLCAGTASRALALAALEELEVRDHTIGREWQMRLGRAEYEAALAERRYQEVDPSQRLVVDTLERRWNTALLHCEELKRQAAEFQRQQARVATYVRLVGGEKPRRLTHTSNGFTCCADWSPDGTES